MLEEFLLEGVSRPGKERNRGFVKDDGTEGIEFWIKDQFEFFFF